MIRYFQFKKRRYASKSKLDVYLEVGEMRFRIKKTNRDNKPQTEQYVKKSTSILIVGNSGSGKSLSLDKFYKNKGYLWRNKEFIYISASDPLSKWVDFEGLQIFCNRKKLQYSKQYHLVDAFISYCQCIRPIIFIDDIHLLKGRKLSIIKSCIVNNLFVCTSLSDNDIAISLRSIIFKRDIQMFELSGKKRLILGFINGFKLFNIFKLSFLVISMLVMFVWGFYIGHDWFSALIYKKMLLFFK